MPQAKLSEIFEYRNVSPSSLQKGNLIYFKYQSPQGVHDKTPLVYVLDKTFDKIYGINLHYDQGELQNIIDEIEEKVNLFLEKQWFSKNPKKKQELHAQRMEFNKSLLEEKEYIEFKRRFNKKELEVFSEPSQKSDAFRSYLYKRMNGVSKLVWKL